jgi:TRAP-type C4-dicarboxylate transport system permease small subunit
MESVKRVVDKIMRFVCLIILASMAILVTYQVITRYLFNQPSAISEALARFLFVWLTMYGGAYVFGKRDHMNLNFIRDKFPPKAKIVLEMISEALIAVFALLIMIYGGWIYTVKQMIQVDPSMQIPMGYIYSSLPGGGLLILFYFVCNETALFKRLKVGR